MSTRVVGKLEDWGDADLGGNDFMNLEEGSNTVRLVSKPYQFYIHWTEDNTGANRKVRCALKNCPLCQDGNRSTARWYVGVINRKNKRCAVLEIGPQIFKQILGLKNKATWGNPREYDIDICRQPKGSQPLYIVSPEPKESLTESEKTMVKEFVIRVNLTKMTEAPTPAEVREKVGMPDVEEDFVSNDFEDPDVPVESSVVDDDEEEDFNFDD